MENTRVVKDATRTHGDLETAQEAVSGHVGFLLARTHQRFRLAMLDALSAEGLHLGQVAVLGALSSGRSLSQRELTKVTGIEKSSMVLVVDSLESAGRVRRAPHATDRRAHAVGLTAAGMRLLERIGPKLQAAEDRLMGKLTDAQRVTLLKLLRRLADP